mmetsp:Transcript_124468/g.265289  ORF Transcript_124468/g.265289 Transcript_124468/m.265289 type:complete len:278 (+) Transcript_124468:1197-2030(+)
MLTAHLIHVVLQGVHVLVHVPCKAHPPQGRSMCIRQLLQGLGGGWSAILWGPNLEHHGGGWPDLARCRKPQALRCLQYGRGHIGNCHGFLPVFLRCGCDCAGGLASTRSGHGGGNCEGAHRAQRASLSLACVGFECCLNSNRCMAEQHVVSVLMDAVACKSVKGNAGVRAEASLWRGATSPLQELDPPLEVVVLELVPTTLLLEIRESVLEAAQMRGLLGCGRDRGDRLQLTLEVLALVVERAVLSAVIHDLGPQLPQLLADARLCRCAQQAFLGDG